MTYNLCFARTLYNYTLYFPYFIGQDRNKMKYTYTVKRKEELMPKREGHKRDTWTHAGCPPRGNVWRHTGFLSLHLFVSFFSVCLFPFRIFVFTKLLMLLNLPECHFPHLFFREIWKKFIEGIDIASNGSPTAELHDEIYQIFGHKFRN